MTQESPTPRCARCGHAHELWACPFVKAVEVDIAGNIRRVEFLTPLDQRGDVGKVEVPDTYPKLGEPQ